MRQSARASKLAAASGVLLAGCALALGSCGSSVSSTSRTASKAPAPPATSRLHLARTPKYAAPPASAPVQSGTVQIAYRNIAIAPDTLRVKAGTAVTWTNYDPVEHNVTSRGGPASFASGNFGEGKSFTVKLGKRGIVHYLCTIHPTTMNGTIEVR